MRCEEKVDNFCKEKIAYNRISESELCERCCLGCCYFGKCTQVCNKLKTELNISQEG